jgi:hypothetical protein
MALGKRLINTGAAAAACSTDSVQAFGADAAYSSNVALYQLDSDGGTTNNVPDTTGNYNGTASNVTYSATGAKFGQAASFNGSSSYISTANPLGTGNVAYTVSAWININTSSHTAGIYTIWDGGTNIGTSLFFKVEGGKISIGNYGGSVTSANTLAVNEWVHVVVTRDTSNNVVLYVNGSSDTTGTLTLNLSNNNPKIGALNTSLQNFNGKIDQVRIFDKAISAEDVATLYAETTSTASNTNPFSEGAGVALYTMDYDASEASGYYDGTASNVEFGVGGKINYGARFNGSSSKIVATNPVSQEPFSVSMWVNYTETRLFKAFIGIGNNTTNAKFFINTQASGGIAAAFQHNGSYIFNFNHSTTGLNDGEWHHLAFSWDGTTNTNAVKFYIDKTLTSSTSTVAASSTNAFTELVIGTTTSASASMIDGDIDQVRIFSKALSSDEVDTLWNSGSGEIPCVYECTTDTVNYPTTNLAYYKLDNSAEDETGSYDGTESNIEYRFGRFGQAAVFNGSSSYIDTGISTLTSAGGSVSLWVKTTDTTASFFGTNSNSDTNRFYFGVRDSKFWIGAGNSQVFTVSASNLIDGNWHNVALTLDGSTAKYYLDGASTPVASLSYSGGGVCNLNPVIGGVRTSGGISSAYYTNGDIDQVRIYSTALTSSQVTELYEEKPCADTSNFKTVLYTGNGGTQYISNVGMDLETDGGLVWIKERSGTAYNLLFDSVRGYNFLSSNTTSAEDTSNVVTLSSYDTNGFTTGNDNGSINGSGDSLVAWVWKAGGDAVNIGVNSITASTPSIASDVSANKEAGFSIVKYTGNASVSTVAHGLDYPPEMIIIKNLDNTVAARNWAVYHSGVDTNPENFFLRLNTSSAKLDYPIWNDTAPNSDVFTLGDTTQAGEANDNNNDHIAYCFHSVAGYSKIGSYTGNGSSSGQTITGLGFNPRFLLVKNTTIQHPSAWRITDSARGDNIYLYANLSNGEDSSSGYISLITDGFRMNGLDSNTSDTFIYMAFA